MRKHTYEAMICIFTLLFASLHAGFAAENIPGKISGDGIVLFEKEHSFAGSISGAPVFGVFDESAFGAKVEVRSNGKTLVLQLQEKGEQYSGDLVETQAQERETVEKKTHIELEKVRRTGQAEGEIIINIDGESLPVKVSAMAFESGHFQAPHFEVGFHGKKISFDFSGQACFGYSANIAMMILGTYVHLGK